MDDATLAALRIVACALVDLGVALAAGALAVAWLPGGAALAGRGVRAAGPGGAALALAAGLALLWVDAMGMADVGPVDGLAEAVDVAVATRFGHAWLVAFAALATLCVAGIGRRRAAALTALFVYVLARAASSHAGADGWRAATGVMALHLLATAGWAGLVIAGALALRADRPSPPDRWYEGVSTLATISLGLVALTGGVVALADLHGSLAPLATSTWGGLLDAKLAAVAAAAALGAFNRFSTLPALRHGDPAAHGRFALVLRAEAVAMLAVLVLAAALANVEPPALAG